MTSIDVLPFYLVLIVPAALALVALLALLVGTLRTTSTRAVPTVVGGVTRSAPAARRAGSRDSVAR